MLQRSFGSLLAVIVAAVGFYASPAQAQRDGEVLDGVVAVVGTHPILRSDVDALAFTVSRGSSPTLGQRQEALEELIHQHIVAVVAERDTTVIVSEDEVTEALQARTQELVRRLGSEEAVQQMYNKSIAQLQQDYRADVRRQLRSQALQRRVYFNVRVTPQEIREWYNRIPQDSLPEVPELVRIAHIVQFPTVEPAAREEARAQIEAIRDSIVAGTPIETLARRYSEDPGSREQGGRYQSLNIRDLVPEFGAVASTLQPGQLSQVFETQFGYHVLRLNSRRGDIIDFNHVLISIDQERTDPSQAIQTLQTVRDSVVYGGGDFSRLAREFSEDPSSSTRGGNVVVPQTGDRDIRFEALGPSWRATLDTLAVGEVSQPTAVQLLDGRPAYHIVKLQRRVPPHLLSLELDYPLIEEMALQEKRQQVLEEWGEGLRERVFVACKDDRLCTGDLAAQRN